jgi:hypothetical protein
MDFWMTIRVLLRRWYIALPVFVVSLGLAGAVFLSVSAQYESTATIVLTSPSTGATVGATGSQSGEKINPLLAFDGSLTTSAQIVIETLKDPAILKRYENVDGRPAEVAVGNGQLAGPFIVVVVTAGSADAATKTTASVLDLARQELASRQQSLQAPESTYIRADSVVSPTPGKALIGGKVRYAAVALVLGLIAGLTAAYGYESYKNYRRIHPEKVKQDKNSRTRPEKSRTEKSRPEKSHTEKSPAGKGAPARDRGAPDVVAEKAASTDETLKPDKLAQRFADPQPAWVTNGTKSEDVTRVLSPVTKPNPNAGPNPGQNPPPQTPRPRDSR